MILRYPLEVSDNKRPCSVLSGDQRDPFRYEHIIFKDPVGPQDSQADQQEQIIPGQVQTRLFQDL